MAAAVAAAVKKRVKLGSVGLEVSAQGFGCRGLWPGGGPTESETYMIKLIHHAINSGVTFIDTSDVNGSLNNEFLIGKALKGGLREKVQLASKLEIGSDVIMAGCGIPAYVRSCCEASLKRLEIDCIDLCYADHTLGHIPIEVTMGELKKLVEEGKIKYVGLSHVGLLDLSASKIRRAHAVHPITAVQKKWSMWSRDLEAEVVPTCRELGIGIVPYSPMCRGFFTAGDKLICLTDDDDWKKIPKFQPKHFETIFKPIREMATRKGCTLSQLGLAWVHHQGDDVVPIPATTTIGNFNHNIGALSVKLTPKEMKELNSYVIDVVEFEPGGYTFITFVNSKTPPLLSWKD